jgi:hypothetical protein
MHKENKRLNQFYFSCFKGERLKEPMVFLLDGDLNSNFSIRREIEPPFVDVECVLLSSSRVGFQMRQFHPSASNLVIATTNYTNLTKKGITKKHTVDPCQ